MIVPGNTDDLAHLSAVIVNVASITLIVMHQLLQALREQIGYMATHMQDSMIKVSTV